MKLYTRLLLIMISLLVIVTLTQFLLNQYSQQLLVNEIQDSTATISQLLQKSVADLTSVTDDEVSNLSEYVTEARRKGVQEVNIINMEGEIIDSSDPAKIGGKRDIHKLEKEKGLKMVPGGKEQKGIGGTLVKPYKLVVPVIIGDENLGFVEIGLLLDNIREIQHDNFNRRLFVTVVLFLLGIGVTVILARRYTEPIHRLANGVRNVSAGDLSVTIPIDRTDEIGELAESFNDMVRQLRERKELESRLKDAEHLSQVGQLAAGIAHEVRNPLNYINLAIGHLKREMMATFPTPRADLMELMDRIAEEVRRANYMIVTFMNYGRPLRPRRTTVRLAEVIDRIVSDELFLDRGVRFERRIPPDLPPVSADGELIETALRNLVSNAIQAMPDSGTVGIDAEACEGGGIRVTVSDEGVGIPPENREKIFTPYFTTKDVGTGLGLAITERIVKEHGGTIVVEENTPRGSRFILTLPPS
ncbi:MAG: ATP-binding protein [Desulfuromonadia bacterium]